MSKPSAHEALIHLMVVVSASDRDMTDTELARIGQVVRSWPIFMDFDPERLIEAAQDCQKRLARDGGLGDVLALAGEAIPAHVGDTAYSMVLEIAAADLEMRLEERRVLELVRQTLDIDPGLARSIALGVKARLRTLT